MGRGKPKSAFDMAFLKNAKKNKVSKSPYVEYPDIDWVNKNILNKKVKNKNK
jgi:hypothetical protein